MLRCVDRAPAPVAVPQPQPESTGPATGLAERRALTNRLATSYARAGKVEKTQILDEVCAATGWHRSHARKALLTAARPKPAKLPNTGHAKYDTDVVAALVFCWRILDMPAGKRLAPMLAELVPVLRARQELDIDDDTAALLVGMSAATIDRRLAPQRQQHQRRSVPTMRMRPGSLLRDERPLLTWADWDHTRPGFVELAVVRHDVAGPHTVSVTDIATGWTENRTVRTLGQIPFALNEIVAVLPFPVLGMDTGNQGTELDEVLLPWCAQRRVTFTHSRPADSGTHHVGQKNWSTVHAIVSGCRGESAAELALLNKVWLSLSTLANYFYPQQHQAPAGAQDGRRRKEYDTATPYGRVLRHDRVSAEDKAIQAEEYQQLNPAQVYRQLTSMTSRLRMMAGSRLVPAHVPDAAIG